MHLGEPARLVGVEAVEQHERAAGQHRQRDVPDEARHVEERRQAEDRVGAGQADPALVDRGREHDVAVRVHRGLRLAGRARRVDHERDVVARELHRPRRLARVRAPRARAGPGTSGSRSAASCRPARPAAAASGPGSRGRRGDRVLARPSTAAPPAPRRRTDPPGRPARGCPSPTGSCTSSRSRSIGLHGTMTAPHFQAASTVITTCGMFCRYIAMRSPGSTPRRCSADGQRVRHRVALRRPSACDRSSAPARASRPRCAVARNMSSPSRSLVRSWTERPVEVEPRATREISHGALPPKTNGRSLVRRTASCRGCHRLAELLHEATLVREELRGECVGRLGDFGGSRALASAGGWATAGAQRRRPGGRQGLAPRLHRGQVGFLLGAQDFVRLRLEVRRRCRSPCRPRDRLASADISSASRTAGPVLADASRDVNAATARAS